MKLVKVIANSAQLKSVGIDYDLTGKTLPVTNIFPDGWYEVEFLYEIGSHTFKYKADVPPYFVEKSDKNIPKL